MKRYTGRRPGRCAGKRGLTLIELMMTLVLLSIGLVGVSSMFVLGFRTQRHAHFASVAGDMASRKIEEMKAAGYNGIDVELFPAEFAVTELPGGQGAVSWEPYPANDSTNQYLVHVVIAWGGGTGIGGRAVLSTVISKHG